MAERDFVMRKNEAVRLRLPDDFRAGRITSLRDPFVFADFAL